MALELKRTSSPSRDGNGQLRARTSPSPYREPRSLRRTPLLVGAGLFVCIGSVIASGYVARGEAEPEALTRGREAPFPQRVDPSAEPDDRPAHRASTDDPLAEATEPERLEPGPREGVSDVAQWTDQTTTNELPDPTELERNADAGRPHRVVAEPFGPASMSVEAHRLPPDDREPSPAHRPAKALVRRVDLHGASGPLRSQLAVQTIKATKNGERPHVLVRAAWCPACRKIEKDLKQPAEGFEDVVLIWVDIDQWADQLADAGIVSKTIPTLYKIDRSGRLQPRHVGANWSQVQGFLRARLIERPTVHVRR